MSMTCSVGSCLYHVSRSVESLYELDELLTKRAVIALCRGGLYSSPLEAFPNWVSFPNQEPLLNGLGFFIQHLFQIRHIF